MRSKMITRTLPLILLIGLFLSCDDFKDQDYELSELDRAVMSIMQDTLLVIEVDLDGLTKFDTTWYSTEIYSNIVAIMDTLENYNQKLIVQDSSYQIDISNSDSSYFYIETDQSNEYAFCFDEPVIFELIDTAGSIITNKSDSRSLEEVAGGVTYYIDENLNRTLEYYITVKNTYDLTQNRYLGRIIKTDMMTETIIKIVVKAGL